MFGNSGGGDRWRKARLLEVGDVVGNIYMLMMRLVKEEPRDRVVSWWPSLLSSVLLK